MEVKRLEPWGALQFGSAIQRKAFEALEQTRILEILKPYHPILAGTIPLDLAVEGSDLDIICWAHDLKGFSEFVRIHFSDYSGFACYARPIKGLESYVAQFEAYRFPFEIFAQDRDPQEQAAVVHMQVEARLLRLANRQTRQSILALKQTGIKTEPAFAEVFGLSGDPYEMLYQMKEFSDDALLELIEKRACSQKGNA